MKKLKINPRPLGLYANPPPWLSAAVDRDISDLRNWIEHGVPLTVEQKKMLFRIALDSDLLPEPEIRWPALPTP